MYNNTMSAIKEKMIETIQSQPEDSTAKDILRELAFENMIDKGLVDSKAGRTISDEEMTQRIHNKWK